MDRDLRRLVESALLAFVGSAISNGCWAATPRIEDAHAPRDFYEQVHPTEPKCDREVVTFPAGTIPGRPYAELSSLSATCSPGAIEICERRMKDHACRLGADAVLLLESTAGPNPAGTSAQTLVSRSGRAIRWQP